MAAPLHGITQWLIIQGRIEGKLLEKRAAPPITRSLAIVDAWSASAADLHGRESGPAQATEPPFANLASTPAQTVGADIASIDPSAAMMTRVMCRSCAPSYLFGHGLPFGSTHPLAAGLAAAAGAAGFGVAGRAGGGAAGRATSGGAGLEATGRACGEVLGLAAVGA